MALCGVAPKVTDLGKRLASLMAQSTLKKTADRGLNHARQNLPFIEHTVDELVPLHPDQAPSAAIVVGAGPSLHSQRSVERILSSGFSGPIVCTDGALGHCLKHGLIPEYVVSVDSHETRIVRWFGDAALEERERDDYWRRQELDPAIALDEVEQNRMLFELMNTHGSKIKHVVATSVHPTVTERVRQIGMSMYWWNPLYDDYSAPNSYSRRVFEQNHAPCLVTGGNVGTACWIIAHAILGAKKVALVGMDLGYEPGRSVEKTQYAAELHELLGKNIEEAFIDVPNPLSGEVWFADPVYYWYRQIFLELAQKANCISINCTEGGTLFGPGIVNMGLTEFLDSESSETKSGGPNG